MGRPLSLPIRDEPMMTRLFQKIVLTFVKHDAQTYRLDSYVTLDDSFDKSCVQVKIRSFNSWNDFEFEGSNFPSGRVSSETRQSRFEIEGRVFQEMVNFISEEEHKNCMLVSRESTDVVRAQSGLDEMNDMGSNRSNGSLEQT